MASNLVVYTIGHSTRTAEALARLLEAHAIDLLADIRTVPRSRRVPHFNRECIEANLAAAGYRGAYVHLAALGGLRRGLGTASPNGGWENAAFRGFADYMLTEAFWAGLDALIRLAQERRVAIMCAEAVPWRCHRSLVADGLLVRRVAVRHIIDERRCQPHRLTPFARVEGPRITYPVP